MMIISELQYRIDDSITEAIEDDNSMGTIRVDISMGPINTPS